MESQTYQWAPTADTIKALLLERDSRESKPYLSLIQTYTTMFWNAQNATDKTNALQSELDSLKASQALIIKELSAYKEGSVGVSSKRLAELEEKCNELKEERTELYKQQSQNAQKLLVANESVRKFEEILKEKNTAIEDLNAKLTALTNQLSTAEQEKREKDITIQVLQDELTALQLELLKIEERNHNLMAENRTLVDRWIAKMNEEAQKMNLANELLQSAKLKQEVSEFVPFEEEKRIGRSAVCRFPNSIPTANLNPHKNEATGLAFSSDGKFCATSSFDNTIVLTDLSSDNTKSILQGSLQGVMCIAIDEQNDFVAGGACDHIARIWNVSSGRVRHTLTGHTGKVSSIDFAFDTSKLYTGSHDRTLKIWDVPRGFCTRTIFASSICNAITIGNHSNSLLISGHLDMNLRFWDERSGVIVREVTGIHTGQVTSVSLSADSRDLITNSRDNTLKLIDIRTFEPVNTYKADSYKVGINWVKSACSPDDRYVIAGSNDGAIFIWNKYTTKLETVLKAHKLPVIAARWNPVGGSNIVSVDKDGNLMIWK